MKKILSYIWPVTRKFPSEFNGTLEISYVNGKKVLDTKNANYSYGSLQKILEIGLTKVNLKSVENLLLLGLGGGSIIQSLRETFEYQKNIIAVEIDPEIIKLAKDEFGISPSNTLQIVQADAFDYVKTSKEKFQLIIIDLFIDTTVPSKFFKKEFCDNVSRLLQKNGFIIFNAGVNLKNNSDKIEKIISNFGSDFKFEAFLKVNGTNTLLVGEKLT
ncbi:fused MFS/spermidine synthase [Aequorivita sp. KMM 9714]|uniref:spermidine synthase n=1 Tax=Aequorivita sp. KMM 9714 TaxID=2707173 RepID=UPI0013EC2995|nr:fused MFS/spermidine synthase [Aequorivita sp. KMM 9714]NGX85151.1 methyltransferase domain-containing protein [Aequorivita sp. KMM 9714]